jgi:6-pyruvoyltetrahydropterin/6-carboxytetrahydropterin synthase
MTQRVLEICKDYRASMAHRIALAYDTKCRNLHGHNYLITVCITANVTELPEVGYYMDFTELDGYVKPVIERIDHKSLNDYVGDNASAERLAMYLESVIPFGEIIEKVKGRNAKVQSYSIKVEENDKSRVSYNVVVE